jgi:Ca2+-binding RTX toxin-like protein
MDKDDILFGDGGNDLIYGDGNQSQPGNGSVAWTLYPDQGNDVIDGGEGNDYLLGQGGNDTLLGGEGNDSLWGDVEKYDSPPDPDGQDALDGGQDRQVSDVDFNYETSDGMFMRWLYCEMLRSNGKNDQNRNAFDSANDEFWLVAA